MTDYKQPSLLEDVPTLLSSSTVVKIPVKTVRVRIAVAVNGHGDWFAQGGDLFNKSLAMLDVVKETIRSERTIVNTFWIEADIPLPETTVIEGKVEG